MATPYASDKECVFLRVGVCVCVCIRVSAHVYLISLYTYVYVCKYTCTEVCTCVRMCVCMYICIVQAWAEYKLYVNLLLLSYQHHQGQCTNNIQISNSVRSVFYVNQVIFRTVPPIRH